MRIIVEAERPSRKMVMKGIEFSVALSPYFFPEYLECSYDESSGCLVIDLKYLDIEPQKETPEFDNQFISLYVGRFTGRLLSLMVKVDRNEVDKVHRVFAETIHEALNLVRGGNDDLEESYSEIEKALRDHKDDIAASLSCRRCEP